MPSTKESILIKLVRSTAVIHRHHVINSFPYRFCETCLAQMMLQISDLVQMQYAMSSKGLVALRKAIDRSIKEQKPMLRNQ